MTDPDRREQHEHHGSGDQHRDPEEPRREPGNRHREPATYAEQESSPGRSFPLLAPVIVAITAGIILLIFVVFGGR